MANTRLLHLDTTQLTAYTWWGGVVRTQAQFPNDAAGHAAFAGYLQSHRRSLFYLLADVPEESFQYESVPFVQGADRKALIRRKLTQYFFGSPLTTAFSLGREKSVRRDERMLFMALTRPQFFEPWLDALRTSEAQVAGIYSVPLIAGGLLARLGLADRHPRMILVTLGRGGIRQTYFEDGRLRFSRLSAAPTNGVEETARACGHETVKLYQYLISQRIVARGTRLPTVVLVHPGQRAVFAALAGTSPTLDFEFSDLVQAARRSAMRGLPTDSSADALFLHAMARHAPREQFADEGARHLFRVWQLKFGMVTAAAVVFVACLLFAAKYSYEIQQLRELRDIKLGQAKADTERYNEILRELPPMPTSLDNLRAVVSRFDAMEDRSERPMALYGRISRALEKSPDVEIRRIEWQLTTNPEDPTQGRGANAAAAPGATAPDLYATALITAALLPGPARDHRAVLRAIERFADSLARDADIAVTVTRLPFDIEPAKALKSTEQSGDAIGDTQFAVRISRKLGGKHDPA